MIKKIGEIFRENKNMQIFYIILIIGVLIVLVANSATSKNTKNRPDISGDSVMVDSQNVQKELSQILSQIRGAGKVSLMLTYEQTGEKHYASDITNEKNITTDAGTSTRSQSQSKQSSKLVTMSKEPLLTKQTYPKVRGVIVVCDGGNDIQVKADITNALKSVLNVDEHKISVFAR